MHLLKISLIILLVSVVLVSGCTSQQTSPQPSQNNYTENKMEDKSQTGAAEENKNTVENEIKENIGVKTEVESPSSKFDDKNLEMLANRYYRYDPVQYQNALADNKVVYLYFYANWCPICKEARPKILNAFNQINYQDVVGFEVHFNDDETKDFDVEITRNYQIPYQHTTVIARGGKETTRSLNALTTEEILLELEKARAS